MYKFYHVRWFVSFQFFAWVVLLFGLAGCHGGFPNIASRPSGARDCVYVQDNWVVPVQLPVVANGRGGLKFVDNVADVGNAYCSVKGVRPFIIEGESPVLMGSSSVDMTVAGNICERSPLFIIYNIPYHSNGDPRYNSYYFRQLFGSRGGDDPMVRRISAAMAVTVKRCGAEPEEIRFVARKIKEVPQDVQFSAVNSHWGTVPLEYTDFYSGRVIPKTSMHVISDNPELEASYWRSEDQRVNKYERDREEKARRQAVGAVLGILFMGAIINSNCQPENNYEGC